MFWHICFSPFFHSFFFHESIEVHLFGSCSWVWTRCWCTKIVIMKTIYVWLTQSSNAADGCEREEDWQLLFSHKSWTKRQRGRQIMAEWRFARWFLNAIRNVVFPVRRHKVHWRQREYVTIEWSSNVAAVAVGIPQIDVGFLVAWNSLNESVTILNSMFTPRRAFEMSLMISLWVCVECRPFHSNDVLGNNLCGSLYWSHFNRIKLTSSSVLGYSSSAIQINLRHTKRRDFQSSIYKSKQISRSELPRKSII